MNHRGWHGRGYLPHFDSPETVQFLTFRLFDSLPAEAAEKLRLQVPVASHTERDTFLDRGYGVCWLGRPDIAKIVQDSLLHFDGERYRLLAWTIMPNHVHVLIEQVEGHRLSDIISSWKRFTARAANQVLGRTGEFWERDFWDTYIRNAEHLNRVVDYIHNNPVKAGLAKSAEEWPWGNRGVLPEGTV